ncbi:hypothetical protein QJQ45_002488 [Haematococcus lacustris]|nr:hypothetical protein QJQ45_002488 [Haematococcus lacustris]
MRAPARQDPGSRPATRHPAPRTCMLPRLLSVPLRTLSASAHTLRQYEPPPRPKQDLEQLMSTVEDLPFLSSSQVEQMSRCFADWAKQPENSRARMTQAQCNAVMALLQRMAGLVGAGKAGNPDAFPPLQRFDSRQLSLAAWSLGKLKPHLPAPAVTSACTALARHSSSSEAMRRAGWRDWSTLLEEARQLLSLFTARAQDVVPALKAQEVSNILFGMGLVLWHDKEVCRQLAERAAQTYEFMAGQAVANSLYGLARLGYLDSSVRSLAAGVAKADLTAFTTQAIANLLYARSMFLALSLHQAVSSGCSQLASEPQLNSMAAALWRKLRMWDQDAEQWGEENYNQLHTASQWLHACTGGQISLAASPALQELVAKAKTCRKNTIVKLQTVLKSDCSWLVQALAAAGLDEVQQAVLGQDGTHCTQLLVWGPRLERGIAITQSADFLHDGSMSGVVAHVKLQQLTHFDAGVMVYKAVFDQLASDSERAAFKREQVRASLPEAESWRQLLHACGGHWAGQVASPAAAPPAAQQQQAGSVPTGHQARQQGALPLPGAQAKSAGALPSQWAGQARNLGCCPAQCGQGCESGVGMSNIGQWASS